MFIGEQPGDREDLAGERFVGPAGRLLRDALEQAGFDPRAAYLTNAVKHFKWIGRGKRRIHEKPNREAIARHPGAALASRRT
jgi:DNA polymerase